MDNLDLIKQFLLRNQNMLGPIKPIVLILLLNETKKELNTATEDRNKFKLSKKTLIPVGKDNYQRNMIDLAKEFYESNIEGTEKIIETLNSSIDKLNLNLNFDNKYPIREQKLACERRKEIEWIFDLMSTKSKYFQIKCFEILKNLIFGELIRIDKPISHHSLYLGLISDFDANSEIWKQSWINEELPDEGLF